MSEQLITVPTADVERHARRQAQLVKARAAYDARRYRANHHATTEVKQRDKPFIGWDGEGPRDAGYALFGNSEGYEICHPYLGTKECLDLVLDCEYDNPNAIHVWFGSNYDVSNILKDIGWKRFSALKHWTQCVWEDFEIEHIPGKWFQVKGRGMVAKIFDIHSFFGGSYVKALTDMGIGTKEEISFLTSEKARRGEFVWAEIDEIRDYWRLELLLMPQLCDKLRDNFVDAGFDVRSWHGPGSLANLAMRKHNISKARKESPGEVKRAAKYAFAGGRFEMFRGGLVEGTVYNADIHSAYPYFCTQLPNLSAGYWRKGRGFELGKYGIYRIRYKVAASPLKPFPLFHRLEGGQVVWDNMVEGWYWSPEAELVAHDVGAEFLESWIFEEYDSADKPFAWIADYYRQRLEYIKEGSVLELTIKLIINSVYGQLAQRTGWDRHKRTAPKSHQLEWAGYITSACRAAVYRVARRSGNALLSIDTDGLFATRPFHDLDMGPDLGKWEVKEYDGGIFWQSGIYALKKGDEWVKGKTRGIPKGRYQPEDLIDALGRGENLKLTRNKFIGYGLALNGQRDRLNTWEKEPVELVFGGEGKRYHNEVKWCEKHCKGGLHEFIARPTRFNPEDSIVSYPHYLPWEEGDELAEGRKRLIDDLTYFDVNGLDAEDGWVMDYA